MPHDYDGNEIKVGDRVAIIAEVTEIVAGEDYCNVAIKNIHPRKPDGMHEQNWVNAAGLVRIGTDAECGFSEIDAEPVDSGSLSDGSEGIPVSGAQVSAEASNEQPVPSGEQPAGVDEQPAPSGEQKAGVDEQPAPSGEQKAK